MQSIKKGFFAWSSFVAIIFLLSTSLSAAAPGFSDNGILVEEWRYDEQWYGWGFFGSSAGIADLGNDVNNVGGEPDTDLEIVTGSDECGIPYPDGSGGYAAGLWYCFDSQGNMEWFTDTQSDESRGSVAIVDINQDDYLEIVGGTTSGETVEVMDRFGNFIWTFPKPPHQGSFMWPAAPAVVDVDPSNDGLEVIIGNRALGQIFCLDGDNSDGVDDGYTWPGGWPWEGVEGTDWDILWIYNIGIEVYASTAVADVDGDGDLEAVVGSTNGNFVILDAKTGTLEASFALNSIYSSAAVADLDGNGLLDIVVGSIDQNIYCLEWDGTAKTMKWSYPTGKEIFSSPAIGDVDGDMGLEIVIGSNDGNVYCLDGIGNSEWIANIGGAVFSSPSLARRVGFGKYGNEWPMFRSNPARTGVYGGPVGVELGVYVGSEDEYFYLLNGDNGMMIDRFAVNIDAYGYWYRGVHTSAAIADVDGDLKLELFFTDWGNTSIHYGHTFWAVEDTKSKGMIDVSIDYRPWQCPNLLMIGSDGIAQVAIVGTDDFDPAVIDPDTVTLVGVAPEYYKMKDLSSPFPSCECPDKLGGDGIIDLILKFSKKKILENLGPVAVGDLVTLKLTGKTFDGVPIEGMDCATIY